MKINDGINGIWSHNDIPQMGEFVLIAFGPFQDFPEEKGRSKNKEDLIKKGEKLKGDSFSYLRIYNDQRKIVWDALLPSTLTPDKDEYDAEYLESIWDKMEG